MAQRLNLPCRSLRAQYEAGESTTRLARYYGCSPTTIAKYLRGCGVALRSSRYVAVPIDAAELERAYLEERLPIATIAARFGVAPSTIGNRRRQYGIPQRPRSPVAACVGSD